MEISDLRQIYNNLASALVQVRKESWKSDLHRVLAYAVEPLRQKFMLSAPGHS
jgi:hypothetical protein